MTLQQLQYLMEVYRTGSISGAAKKLFLAQSSLSASISSLENELGFPLFVRAKSGMTPTVQGYHVIEQASHICESYQTMLNTNIPAKHHIRISAPCYEPLNKAFSHLVDSCRNDTCFTLDSLSTAEIVEKLSCFQLDIAVLMNHEERMLTVETLLASKHLKWKNLGCVPVVIQIGPGHRLYDKETIYPQELQEDLFIDNGNDPLLHNEYLKGVISLSPEKTISVKSAHIGTLLLSQGLGYTIGTGAPRAEAQTYGLRSIPLNNISYRLNVVTNPKGAPSAAVEQYIYLLEHELINYLNAI